MTSDVLALLIAAFGIGIVVGLTGMGGGALMTPALIVLGVPPTSAVANDLVAAAVNKSVGAAVHWREGSPHRTIAGWLMLGSVPTAFAGAFIVRAVGGAESRDDFVKVAIGITLVVAASTYAFRLYLELRRGPDLAGGSSDPRVRPLLTFLIGVVGGLCVGLTSVGSGTVMMVALLVLYPTLGGVRLVGTDLVQAVPLVVAAATSHVIVTGVDWSVLIPLIVGGTPGTFLGARVANRVPQSVIRRGIVILLALTGMGLLGVPPLWVAGVGVIGIVSATVFLRAVRSRHLHLWGVDPG